MVSHMLVIFLVLHAVTSEAEKHTRRGLVERERQANRTVVESERLHDDEEDGDDEDDYDEEPVEEEESEIAPVMMSVTTETYAGDEDSTVTTSRTQVTDEDSFRQHETIMGNMPDIKQTTMEVALVVRSQLFKNAKFTNSDEMFDFKPERDNQDPMRGVFYRFLRKECKHQGGDDGIWWAAVQKEVHRSIAKKRTTVTQAMKNAFVGKMNYCRYHVNDSQLAYQLLTMSYVK
jgi:hypothetical protein